MEQGIREPIRTGERLEKLKALMKGHILDALVVPTQDAHGSEYICAADKRREFLTGFTGSAGTAIVLAKDSHGYLFTDGRYFNQALKELDSSCWKLVRQGVGHQSSWQQVLLNHLNDHFDEDASIRIGCDPQLISVSEVEDLVQKLKPFAHSQLVPTTSNLVDTVWDGSRPKRTHRPLIHLDLKYSGKSTQDKLDKIYETIYSYSSHHRHVLGMIFSALDDIAWLLNLRGSDIDYNPVFFSYVWVGFDEDRNRSIVLFIEDCQLKPSILEYLNQQQISVKPYDQIWDHLSQMKHRILNRSPEEIMLNVLITNQTSWAVQAHLGGPSNTIQIRSPIQDLKAIKNSTEIEGFKSCHIRDGAALVSYFAWLEDQLLIQNNQNLNEYDAGVKLEHFRKQFSKDQFRGLSFETISSSGKNAAIIHYSPDSVQSDLIDKDQIYLCDSGAQYLDGTTDVTRTWHFGTPKPEEIRAFTRVLQGHIGLGLMVFPEKTTGYALDPFARQHLWKDGLDYKHGTGHGVGHYLNVHEGPQGIGSRQAYNDVPLKLGMVLSNEPGYYKDDHFGIRIESMMIVIKKPIDHEHDDELRFLSFENLTLCPIQTKLIDKKLLNGFEIDWINDYHQLTLEKLRPLLKDDQKSWSWLEKECQPISK